jgi:hypothetical protein
MDYRRIYAEFIEDRRSRERAPGGYSERHHIKPRCMGGDDSPANLIRLSPEDHYFAHLLLAYAHGGKNWVSIHAMCYLANEKGARERTKLCARMQFGHVRRALARHYRDVLSGPEGKIADKRKHTLRHMDGREVTGNRFELSFETGVTRQQISAVLRGAKKSAHGWYTTEHNPDGLSKAQLLSSALRSTEQFDLYHFDGRSWRGSIWDFRDQFGVALTFQHDEGCVQGWYRKEEQAEAHGALRTEARRRALVVRGNISGKHNPNADPKEYRFKVVQTGEIIAATKTEIRERFGLKSANLCAVFNGKQTQTGGIGLADAG